MLLNHSNKTKDKKYFLEIYFHFLKRKFKKTLPYTDFRKINFLKFKLNFKKLKK